MQTTGKVAGATVGSAGATITAVGLDERSDLLGVGLVGVIVAALIVVGATLDRRAQGRDRPAADAYEVGHALGYAQGQDAGRRLAKPVVVPMNPSPCTACGHNVRDGLQERRAATSALRAKASER